MMTEHKYWQVLTLQAEPDVLEIVGSMLIGDSLGAINADSDSQFYFDPAKQKQIEALLNGLSQTYSFGSAWKSQDQEPWHLAWKDNFTPVKIADKLVVVPDWDNETTAEILIRIRPGMAFGTGHHETTWLMLDALLTHLKPGMSVLDVGSGSGILAIAANGLGAQNVECIEFDLDCEDNFHENLALNNITSGIRLNIGDVLQWRDFSQDIILANVNLLVIKDLIPLLEGQQGMIILSGLLKTDEETIRNICTAANFNILNVIDKGEWIRIELLTNKTI